MDLTKASELFEELGSKIRAHRKYISGNELVTRVLLIDPVLEMLGWDIRNPQVVNLEFRTAQTNSERADYLLNKDGSKFAVVEAKKLGFSFGTNERRQVKEYADYADVTLCVLTDGAKWLIYDLNHGRNPEEMQPCDEFDLEQHSPNELALRSLVLWRGNPGSVPTPVLESIVRPVERHASFGPNGDTTKIAKGSNRQLDGGWQRLDELPDGNGSGPPTQMRLGNKILELPPPYEDDEQSRHDTDWKGFLVSCLKWLVKEGKLTKDECPVELNEGSKKQYILNVKAWHQNTEFINPVKIGGQNPEDEFWIETNSRTSSKIRTLVHLLQTRIEDCDTVWVRFG